MDEVATGATDTMNDTSVDLPSIGAAWWSATDHNPAGWIRPQQGDRLNDLVRFYLCYLRPGFAFTDINDPFRGDWNTHDEFCQGPDIATPSMRTHQRNDKAFVVGRGLKLVGTGPGTGSGLSIG